MLNVRMSRILQELMAAKDTITSEYLANVIHVTSRTIRNDLKVLDALLSKHSAQIKSVQGTGYELKNILPTIRVTSCIIKGIFGQSWQLQQFV